MEIGWTALAFLCLAGALAWFWHDSLAAREHANIAAMEACQRLGLQFLDGTVAFAGFRFVRVAGWLRIKRNYVFDYTSDSIARRQGFVVLIAHQVESVGFAQIEEQRLTRVSTPPHVQIPSNTLPENVLDLAEWRRRRSPQPPATGVTREERGDGRTNS